MQSKPFAKDLFEVKHKNHTEVVFDFQHAGEVIAVAYATDS